MHWLQHVEVGGALMLDSDELYARFTSMQVARRRICCSWYHVPLVALSNIIPFMRRALTFMLGPTTTTIRCVHASPMDSYSIHSTWTSLHYLDRGEATTSLWWPICSSSCGQQNLTQWLRAILKRSYHDAADTIPTCPESQHDDQAVRPGLARVHDISCPLDSTTQMTNSREWL